MTKTAARRHEHDRHMRRRLRTPRWAWVEAAPDLSDDDRAALRNRAARHSVPCSCPMCGHVRAMEGPTVQERRADRVWDWEGAADGGRALWDELDELYDEWTDEDWLLMSMYLMGQMYEREEIG